MARRAGIRRRLAMVGRRRYPNTVVTPEIAARLPATPLFGRYAELEHLRARLCDPWVRLVTLTGCPGVGKSALAFHAALVFYHLFRGAVVVPTGDIHAAGSAGGSAAP